MESFSRKFEIAVILATLTFIAGYAAPSPTDKIETIRAYTRGKEFDYLEWMSAAELLKLRAASVRLPYAIDRETQKRLVMENLRLTQSILDEERRLETIYADPAIADKESAAQETLAQLAAWRARAAQIVPLAESVLQEQTAAVLAEIGLAQAGQPLPFVWYHASPLPMALIVSPRERIEQTANISLRADATLEEQIALEERVAKGLNVSVLVVPIGGVGVYPTMVMRSADLNWLATVIAHEWIHNYLSFYPLGGSYSKTPELRAMNETTASIAGNEIGALVIERFYPELAPRSSSTGGLISLSEGHVNPGDLPRPTFDFRAEMHETRVRVDELLAAGKIEEAEAYMEQRRQIFWQNGYLIRKLNQAYFAFYGAYADSPGGAAGEDPVGPAVRALRAQSASLADFIRAIKWMTSFEELQQAVQR